jgi:alkylation response protein AidB-like acyl-CoA dehydrogenase
MTSRPDIAALRRDVRDLIARWRAEARFVPSSDNWLRGFDPAFSKELARLGLIGLTWPVEYGGGGLTNVARLAVTEELLRAGAPVAAHWIADRQIGPSVLRHGSERLRREILPGIVSADLVFCLGMSEPEAGSDLASVRTFAAAVDGGWLIRGHKIWTSGAHHATHCYVLARTERAEQKHVGLSEFIVDMDSPGITVSAIVDLTGEHHINEVLFDDVFVPDYRVLGELGNGWRQVIEQLSFERGGPERILSSYPLFAEVLGGLGRLAGLANGDGPDVDVLVELGELTARLGALRGLSLQIAESLDRGAAPVPQSATLKYLGNAFEADVIEFARKVTPGAARDSAFGHTLLTSPGYPIRGGAAEVLLSLIANAEVSPMTADEARGSDAELINLVDEIAKAYQEPDNGELPACWATLVELGLPLVGIPETRGGSGGTVADLVVVVRALGRNGISTPLIEAAVSNWVLAGVGRFAEAPFATVAVQRGSAVPWARHASGVVLADGDEVAIIDLRAAELRREVSLAGEPWDWVDYNVLPSAVVTGLPGGPSVAQVRARLGLLRAAALTGAAEGAYSLTRDYVIARQQFGKPLIRIPAVATNLARMKTAVLQSEVALARAGDEQLGSVAAARVLAGKAATEAARLAHQLHGAMGITAEYRLHFYTRRLWAWRDADLDQRAWSMRLGRLAAAGGEAVVWQELSA